jgi:hypothetical protein
MGGPLGPISLCSVDWQEGLHHSQPLLGKPTTRGARTRKAAQANKSPSFSERDVGTSQGPGQGQSARHCDARDSPLLLCNQLHVGDRVTEARPLGRFLAHDCRYGKGIQLCIPAASAGW